MTDDFDRIAEEDARHIKHWSVTALLTLLLFWLPLLWLSGCLG